MQKARENGITLVELLLVIIIMGFASSLAVPVLSSLDNLKLELVSRELQRAIRFAHSESTRTGITYGLSIENADSRVRLYKYATAVDYNVYDPVEKQPYDLYFGTTEQPVTLSSKSIKFESSAINTQNYIAFAAGNGTPVSNNVGNASLLEYADIVLSYNGYSVKLSISPVSAMVTLQ